MCGILGVCHFKNKVSPALLKSIAHRGPDDSYWLQDENVFLGHVRLSIQDLSPNGRQPMSSENGEHIIIFNGEIYNHNDLRAELAEKGYTFRSTSDTETLLYAYIEWGEKILNRLNGIFAFAIYTPQTGELFIARDHFGIKPLYYYHTAEGFAFSSELKALLPLLDNKEDISAEALCNYIHYLWSPGKQTPFSKVLKIEPGHYVKLKIGETLSADFHKYYHVPFNGKYIENTETAIIDQLEQKLLKAVERQLLSDVPVGFFLSGGLDSSLLVAMARKITGKKLKCFTIRTENDAAVEGFSDDLYYAKAVAESLEVDLEIVDAQINIVRDFDRMIWHLDEPQADAAPLNVLNISRRAKDLGYKVLIGGTAGDDLFTGYRRHQAIAAEKLFTYIPKPLARLLNAVPLNTLNPRQRRIKKIIRELALPTNERLANYFAWLPLERNKALFSPQYHSRLKSYNPAWFLQNKLKEIPEETSWINRMLYWEFNSFLVDHNLNYTDKMGMAEGVEIRVPFLDTELVDFAAVIPPELKMKGRETKYILKKVAERYLPHEVIYRPKSGFGAPVRKWILEDMASMIEERLSPERIQKRGIFDSDAVWQLIADNKAGRIDASYPIWSLLAIDSWLTQFSENNSHSKSNYETTHSIVQNR